MKVQILTQYDKLESVNVRDLRRLIAAGEVLAFHRSDGWVKIGADPIRGDGGQNYNGPERRNFKQKAISEEQLRNSHHCVVAVTGPESEW